MRLQRTAILAAIGFCIALTHLHAGASRGPVQMPGGEPVETVFKTGFEKGEDFPEPHVYSLTTSDARSGNRSLTTRVDENTPVRQYRIPIQGKKGHRMRITLWRKSRKRCRFALFWEEKNTETGHLERSRLYTHPVGAGWEKYTATFIPKADKNCDISIVFPSYHNHKNATRAWLDDVRIDDMGPAVTWSLDRWEDFPALSSNGKGPIWIAVLERIDSDPVSRPQVGVYRVKNDARERVGTLRPEGITGISKPTVAAHGNGCTVAFGAEKNGKYDIYYARIRPGRDKKPQLKKIAMEGNANILPSAAATGNRTYLVWETNAPGHRTIAGCWVESEGPTEPRILSGEGSNSSNPEVTALENGAVFAAWDAFRHNNVDIYGRRWNKAEWQDVRRLTKDPRIERHPSLASHGQKVWMAWEAKSFNGTSVNHLSEQRVVVASLGQKSLRTPLKLFKTVRGELFLRPWIGFDRKGRLWLTARRSLGHHSGWEAWGWCYSGSEWTKKQVIWDRSGRWRQIPVVWSQAGTFAAVQRDNIKTRNTSGLQPSCNSEVALVDLGPIDAPQAAPLKTTPLQMPQTSFDLQEQRLEPSHARQKRQQISHDGETLTLYWGDLHEHTSMSACQRAINPPAPDLLANQRDIEKLDFTAITDHGYNLDEPQWQYTSEQINSYFDPGRFLTLLGEEWTSKNNSPENPDEPVGKGNPQQYGHRNLILRNAHYPRFFDSFDGNITPEEVWTQLEGDEFFMVPHQLADWHRKGKGNPPVDWEHHHPHHQPVAEIYQSRGSYEALGAPREAGAACPFDGHFLQDAWEKGVVIGVIASPDHGGGNGKAGVWAEDMTRDALFKAIYARHTFGTTDPKIMLYFGSGDAMMGDKLQRLGRSSLPFNVRVKAPRKINNVVIFRNNGKVKTWEPGTRKVELEWTDEKPPTDKRLWYYVRVQCADDSLAWASPIWFVPR